MSDSFIAQMRKSYEAGALDETEVAAHPMTQLRKWLDDAIANHLPEPNAMNLATVGPHGRPSSRIVLIKGLDEQGIVWFTNYESRKGRELALHPFAAINFHWISMERQVRVEGTVEKISEADSDEYFHSRPLASRIGAWASPQSQVISSRAVLMKNAAEVGARFLLNPPRPPYWGGYRLLPDYAEFWQGRPSRLHDRITYTKNNAGAWLLSRLAP